MESQNTLHQRAGASHTVERRTIVDSSFRPSPLGHGWLWRRIRPRDKEHVLRMVTYLSILQGRSRHLLKVIGLVDPGRAKARAIDRLQARLFRLTGVQAVALRGFAKSSSTVHSEFGDDISVILSKDPDSELQGEIERIFFEINRRHGTNMAPVFTWKRGLDSVSG